MQLSAAAWAAVSWRSTTWIGAACSSCSATCLNLSIFTGACLMQAGFGQVVGLWRPDLAGHYPAQAYRVAFGTLVLLQLPGLAAYFRGYFLRRRQVECGIALLAQKEEYEIGTLRSPR
jgi:hypothetical protein